MKKKKKYKKRVKPKQTLHEKRLKFLSKYLRRVSVYWPMRHEAFRKAKVGPGLYLCVDCKKSYTKEDTYTKIYKNGNKTEMKILQCDHIIPVIDLKTSLKETTVQEYVERLLCGVDNLRILCAFCHQKKSAKENDQRRANKKVK